MRQVATKKLMDIDVITMSYQYDSQQTTEQYVKQNNRPTKEQKTAKIVFQCSKKISHPEAVFCWPINDNVYYFSVHVQLTIESVLAFIKSNSKLLIIFMK